MRGALLARGHVIAVAWGLFGAGVVVAVPPESLLRSLERRAFEPEPSAWESAVSPNSASSSGGFSASGITLLSQVTVPQLRGSLNATAANDIWGYVSASGREYAIVGLNVGTAFVEVTDPQNPVVVASLVDASSTWSDMKTYQTYAYNVNESGGGVQIFGLGSIDSGLVSALTPFTASGLQTAHNIAINEESGHAYLCGSNIGGGLVALDLANPRSPTFVGAWVGPYVHDAQIVTYHVGPYAGREIAFCFCGGSGLRIVDVTNKNNMFTLGSLVYPNTNYCHQGWLSEDRLTLYVDDELDELQSPSVNTTTTYVVDVQDLSNPTFVTSYTNGMPSIDHNLFVRGDYIFLANYTSGLRVYDATDRTNLQEVGYFDSYPGSNGQNFNGAWGNYPYLPSGVVLVSDQSGGLFVLDASAVAPPGCSDPQSPAAELNPVAKNRYVSFRPRNAGRQVALQVTFTDLPAPFENLAGMQMWVDEPSAVSTDDGTMNLARLRCDALYRDWGDVGELHLIGPEIIPHATYTITAFEWLDCGEGAELVASGDGVFDTSPVWGDLVGGSPVGPDGSANFADVTALVEAFKDLSSSPSVSEADLTPEIPDQVTNFADITAGVSAFKGDGYPYAGPSACQ